MKMCAWDGCEKRANKRQWCNSHYERLRLSGRITTDKERDPVVRFWRKVAKSDGCWTWQAAKVGSGYGRVHWGGWVQQAHRVAYELLVGPIPDGLHLDHLCRNPGCVNPAHLEPVTPGENVLRGVGVSAVHANATHCHKGHLFDEANTYIDPNGWRRCRACHREQVREAQAKAVKPIKNAECLVCGRAFSYVGHVQRICSDKCRKARAVQHTQAYQARKGR